MINLDEIEWRIGSSKVQADKAWATFLIYIDARVARRELNSYLAKKYKISLEEAQGFWQFEVKDYKENTVLGKLWVWNKEGWNVYEDFGYSRSSGEPLKDATSDAFKRCAVHLGVGEILYQAPFLYLQEKTQEGKYFKYHDGKIKAITDMADNAIYGKVKTWYEGIQRERETSISK